MRRPDCQLSECFINEFRCGSEKVLRLQLIIDPRLAECRNLPRTRVPEESRSEQKQFVTFAQAKLNHNRT